MPLAVTHILVPLILMALIRDFYFKNKKKFSLRYVLIAGISGVIPDLDIAAFWVLYFFGFTFEQVHKTVLHSLLIPILFFLFFIIFKKLNLSGIGRHKLKLNLIFLMMAFGSFTHLILDAIFGELIMPFWPLNNSTLGMDIITYLPKELQWMALPMLDGLLLIIWLIYLEFKHRISDFI
ncbi:MAG: metal-dependent hydrolase [Nanoarchaeota archaeon]